MKGIHTVISYFRLPPNTPLLLCSRFSRCLRLTDLTDSNSTLGHGILTLSGTGYVLVLALGPLLLMLVLGLTVAAAMPLLLSRHMCTRMRICGNTALLLLHL